MSDQGNNMKLRDDQAQLKQEMLIFERGGSGDSHGQHTGAVVMRCESQFLGAGYRGQFFANDGRPIHQLFAQLGK